MNGAYFLYALTPALYIYFKETKKVRWGLCTKQSVIRMTALIKTEVDLSQTARVFARRQIAPNATAWQRDRCSTECGTSQDFCHLHGRRGIVRALSPGSTPNRFSSRWVR